MIPVEQWNAFLAVVILVYLVVALSCFLIQRKEFPVAQRFPYVVMFELTIVGVDGVVSCLTHWAFTKNVFVNCQKFLLFELTLGFVVLAILILRTQFQLMKDFSTKLLVQQSNAAEYSEETSKNLHISSKEGILFKLIYSLLALEMKYLEPWSAALLHITPVLIGAVTALANISATKQFSSLSAGSADCINYIPSQLPLNIGNIVYGYFLLSTIPIFVLFQRMKDSLYLVLELRLLVIFFFVEFFLLLFQGNTEAWKWMDGLQTLITMTIQFFPVIISFRLQKTRKLNEKTDTPTASSIGEVIEELRKVINTPELRLLFLKHLEMEYSVENLAFYEACVSLEIMIENSRNETEIVEKVQFVRDTFLLTSAISSVNISHPNRLKALEVIGKDESLLSASHQSIVAVLKNPKEEILKLMATDSFGRFKRSDLYTQEQKTREKKSLFNDTWNALSTFGNSSSKHDDLEAALEVLNPLKE
jgi:hypothetical protein